MTIDELFAAGAHHTVESLFVRGEFAYRDIAAALERRFGAAGISSPPAVSQLLSQVAQAQTAARAISTPGLTESPLFGENPAIPQQYQYAVIARLPVTPGSAETISVPWTINSAEPLSHEDIVAQATEELNAGIARPDYPGEAKHADLLRRDEAINRRVRDDYGGAAPFDIELIGVYTRG